MGIKTVREILLERLHRYEWDCEPTAVPTTEAELTGTETYVSVIFVVNTTAGALTVSVRDNQTTPKTYIEAKSIAANDILLVNFIKPVKLRDGVRHVASGSGLLIVVAGYQ